MATRALEALRTDPHAFGTRVLGNEYTDDQRAVFRALQEHDKVVVPAGHAVGKTYLASSVVPWFVVTHPNAKVITTAPTNRQVVDILWSGIRGQIARCPYPLGGELLPKAPAWHFSDEHFAIGFSTDDAERFQGYHAPHMLIVMDEAAGLDPKTWLAVERVSSGGNCKILAIGNPGGPDGPFYSAATSSIWKTLHLSCMNHPNIVDGRTVVPGAVSPTWVAERREEWGEDSPLWSSYVLGEFPPEGVDTLISLTWVMQAMERSEPDGDERAMIVVDVARYGDDETVISAFRGRRAVRTVAYVGRGLMETVGQIVEMERTEFPDHTHGVQILVDDDGVGGGVTDRLRELERAVFAYQGSAKPRESDRFVNRRGEAWWGLRESLRTGTWNLPDDGKLKAQLCSVRYKYRSDGRIEIESKEKMRDRGVKSPDRADVVVMADWGFRNLAPMGAPTPKKPRRAAGWRRELTGASARDWKGY